MVKKHTGKLVQPPEKQKPISEQMDEIIYEICENYCKYPEICVKEAGDPDAAENMLFAKYCESCTLTRW